MYVTHSIFHCMNILCLEAFKFEWNVLQYSVNCSSQSKVLEKFVNWFFEICPNFACGAASGQLCHLWLNNHLSTDDAQNSNKFVDFCFRKHKIMDIISQLTENSFLAIIARQILEKLSLSDLIAAEGKLSRLDKSKMCLNVVMYIVYLFV